MNIILDGFGGDHAPLEVLRGAAAAVKAYNITVTVTGEPDKLSVCAAEHNVDLTGISFESSSGVIPMDADPTQILKSYSECSMAVGLKALAEGKGDAFVSAGSTGALLVGSTFLTKRSRGVKRPAIGTLIPTGGGKCYLLIDSGANHDCRPEMLCQFAAMGTVYYRQMMGVEAPRVGLVNIGTEEHKGDDLRREAYKLLSQMEGINFIGNVEARELPNGGCDVAVCDGFTGNIVLKLTEGFGAFFSKTLKGMLFANAGTKLAALLLKGQVAEFKKSLDYKEHGGAPLLGVRHPVIKAHGSSNGYAFQNAIRQAVSCCEKDVVGQIERGVAAIKNDGAGKEEEQ